MDHAEYLKRVKSFIKTPTKDLEKQLEEFCAACTYVSGQYDRDDSFQELNRHLEELEQTQSEAHRLFYMALPPSVFTVVSQHLKKNCYPTRGIARVIVGSHLEGLSRPSRMVNASIETNLRIVSNRSRNPLERTWLAPESCRSRWRLTGMKTSFSVLTTTSERKWSRTSSSSDSVTSSSALLGTGIT